MLAIDVCDHHSTAVPPSHSLFLAHLHQHTGYLVCICTFLISNATQILLMEQAADSYTGFQDTLKGLQFFCEKDQPFIRILHCKFESLGGYNECWLHQRRSEDLR